MKIMKCAKHFYLLFKLYIRCINKMECDFLARHGKIIDGVSCFFLSNGSISFSLGLFIWNYNNNNDSDKNSILLDLLLGTSCHHSFSDEIWECAADEL